MRTSSRQVSVLLFDEVELLDFCAPVEVLSTAGRHYNFRPFKITTTSVAAGLIDTRNQVQVQATCALGACPPADVLLVPGGYGARKALASNATHVKRRCLLIMRNAYRRSFSMLLASPALPRSQISLAGVSQ